MNYTHQSDDDSFPSNTDYPTLPSAQRLFQKPTRNPSPLRSNNHYYQNSRQGQHQEQQPDQLVPQEMINLGPDAKYKRIKLKRNTIELDLEEEKKNIEEEDEKLQRKNKVVVIINPEPVQLKRYLWGQTIWIAFLIILWLGVVGAAIGMSLYYCFAVANNKDDNDIWIIPVVLIAMAVLLTAIVKHERKVTNEKNPVILKRQAISGWVSLFGGTPIIIYSLVNFFYINGGKVFER